MTSAVTSRQPGLLGWLLCAPSAYDVPVSSRSQFLASQ